MAAIAAFGIPKTIADDQLLKEINKKYWMIKALIINQLNQETKIYKEGIMHEIFIEFKIKQL